MAIEDTAAEVKDEVFQKAKADEKEEAKTMLKDKPEDKKDVEKAKDDDEDLSDLNDDEKCSYKALKAKVKKNVIAKTGLEQSPVDSAKESENSEHSINSGAGASGQHILTPHSSINVSRDQNLPMGKSAVEGDLQKSPLFLGVTKQLDDIKFAVSNKVDALEKSVNDRLSNITKDMEKIEKFYSTSFYKAAPNGSGPIEVVPESVSKQLEAGKARFSL